MIAIKEYFTDPEWTDHLNQEIELFEKTIHTCDELQVRAKQLQEIIESFRRHVKRAKLSGEEITDYDVSKMHKYTQILREILPGSSAINPDAMTERALRAIGHKGIIGETGVESSERGQIKRVQTVFTSVFDRFVNRAARVLKANPVLLSREYNEDDLHCYTHNKEADLFMIVFGNIKKANGGQERVSPPLKSQYAEA